MTYPKVCIVISLACFMAGGILSLLAHDNVLALLFAGLAFNAISKL